MAISFLFFNFSVTMSFNLSAIRLLLTFLQSRDLVWFGFKTSPSNRLALSFKICILGPVSKQQDILNSLRRLQDQCEGCTGCLQTCSKATGCVADTAVGPHVRLSVCMSNARTHAQEEHSFSLQSLVYILFCQLVLSTQITGSYPLDRVSAAPQEVP